MSFQNATMKAEADYIDVIMGVFAYCFASCLDLTPGVIVLNACGTLVDEQSVALARLNLRACAHLVTSIID